MQNLVEIRLDHKEIENIIQNAAPSVEIKIHIFVPPPLLRTRGRRNIYTKENEECKYQKKFFN